jgi:hypothetical protein
MAYRRSSDGMRLLSAWNIIIDLVLPFIFNGGRRLCVIPGKDNPLKLSICA